MIPKNVKEICELFDCSVCTDLAPRGFGNNLKPVYYIGETTELRAGLYGYHLTPHFFSEQALQRYCASQKGRTAINDKAKEVFPNDWLSDYQVWFDYICDGCFDIRGINASEHKCHSWSPFGHKVSDFYMHKGEKVNAECQCPECNPTIRIK